MLTKRNSEYILFLNKKIYDKKAVEQAFNDFNELCKIKEDQENFIIIFKENDIALEFANYVLGIMRTL